MYTHWGFGKKGGGVFLEGIRHTYNYNKNNYMWLSDAMNLDHYQIVSRC